MEEKPNSKTVANQPKQKRKGQFDKNDPRINRNGRPPSQQSWAGVFSELLEMTPEQLVEMVGGVSTPLGKIFTKLPKNQKIKTTMALKAIAQYAQTPKHTPLLDSIMNRTDGTPRQTLILGGQVSTKNYVGWTPDQWDEMNKQEDVPEANDGSSTDSTE